MSLYESYRSQWPILAGYMMSLYESYRSQWPILAGYMMSLYESYRSQWPILAGYMMRFYELYKRTVVSTLILASFICGCVYMMYCVSSGVFTWLCLNLQVIGVYWAAIWA